MPESKSCPESHRRLVDRLNAQAADVQRLTAGLHENHLSKHVVSSRWSLKELVSHLHRMQGVYVQERLELMLARENPELPAYAPDSDPAFVQLAEQAASETVASYMREREQLVARLKGLTAEQWHRPGRHPVYSQSDVYALTEYLVHHEAHHIYQMYQRRALLGPVPE
jgi:hypothetical protein